MNLVTPFYLTTSHPHQLFPEIVPTRVTQQSYHCGCADSAECAPGTYSPPLPCQTGPFESQPAEKVCGGGAGGQNGVGGCTEGRGERPGHRQAEQGSQGEAARSAGRSRDGPARKTAGWFGTSLECCVPVPRLLGVLAGRPATTPDST